MPVLNTTPAASNPACYYGIFFDIVAKGGDVRVEALACETNGSIDQSPVDFWACDEGSCQGREQRPECWRKVGSGTFALRNKRTNFVLTETLHVPAGGTVGLHIFCASNNSAISYGEPTDSGGPGKIDVENDDIALVRGAAVRVRDMWKKVNYSSNCYVAAGAVTYEASSLAMPAAEAVEEEDAEGGGAGGATGAALGQLSLTEGGQETGAAAAANAAVPAAAAASAGGAAAAPPSPPVTAAAAVAAAAGAAGDDSSSSSSGDDDDA